MYISLYVGTSNRSGAAGFDPGGAILSTAEALTRKGPDAIELDALPREATEDDARIFQRIISTELDDGQVRQVITPARVFPRHEAVLAVHWHPEHVPMHLIRKRIDATFPKRRHELIIPTQHNILTSYDDHTGVEVDCYNAGFHRKVQLLFHFHKSRLEDRGDVLKAMIQHTASYRASQLFEYIDSVLADSLGERVAEAAEQTGAGEKLVAFVRIHVARLKELIERYESVTPKMMIKNKLVREYFDGLRDQYQDRWINHAQLFLKAVKKIVKRSFSLEYFYQDREMIEEARALGAGIVIPHPEQFWPILLDDLDVDGFEVWNPQSFEYTDFLIDVVHRVGSFSRKRQLLIFMGDDTHLGEKIKEPARQDPAKAAREIGVQPPWDDLAIRKRLIAAGTSRLHVIEEYRRRLDG